jgi:hypothetical protein
MKEVNEILKDKRIQFIYRNTQTEKSIQLKLLVNAKYNNKQAHVKFTSVLDWEHLSVSFDDEIPTWDFMQEMKEMFWKDDEICYQLHPKKSEYINDNEYCLHIWRYIKEDVKTPPTIFIGFRNGHEEEDKRILKKIQEDMGTPLSDCEIDLIMLNNIKDPIVFNNEYNKLVQKYSLKTVIESSMKIIF